MGITSLNHCFESNSCQMASRVLFIVAFISVSYYWQTRIKQGPVYESEVSLKNKTVILTGGNSGIGKHTAIEIAKRDAHLIIASRNTERSTAVKQEIMQLTGNGNIRVLKLDLEDFASVRSFAKEVLETEKHIDYLVNNAGALFLPGITRNGHQRVFTINHLGHFLLTNLLLDKMKAQTKKEGGSRPVRIINLSSVMYKFGALDWNNLHFDPKGIVQNFKAYSNSKLANIYFTRELYKRVRLHNITTFAVHPGNIATDIGINIFGLSKPLWRFLTFPFLRETHYGPQTTMYAMLDAEVVEHSGKYLSDCGVEELYPHASNDTIGEELW